MSDGIKRIIIVGICILLQLVLTLLFFMWFSGYSTIFRIILQITSIIIVLSVIKESKNLSLKLPWIMIILIAPIFGTLLYIIIGQNKYQSKTLKDINESVKNSQKYLNQDKEVLEKIEDLNIYGQASYLSNYAKYPVYQNTELEYFKLGEDAYKVILNELKKAKKFIFLEYFIIDYGTMWTEILNILEEKVKEGLDVRIIYDDVGCIRRLRKNYDKYLEKKGIKCLCFNELKSLLSVIVNNRDHRKIMIIDGNISFTGGINIADEYINKKRKYGHWKDNAIMLKGEATWSFTLMFLQMWNAHRKDDEDFNKFKPTIKNNNDGFICPYAECPLDNEIVGENVYLNMINQAKKYIYITTPYLIIDNDMVTALTLASKRGVDVKIITPGIPDKKIIYSVTKSYYKCLIKDGVKIYEYEPGFIHSKIFICDDEISTIGTINLDYRSLYHHFECGVYIYNSNVIKNIKQDMIDTLDKSRLINKKNFKPNLLKELFNAILRLIAPLL